MIVGRKPLTFTVAPDISKRPDNPVIPPAANGGKQLVRTMQQLYADSSDRPILRFTFPMGITSFQHEAPSVAYEEIQRPLSLPLLDTTAAQLHKVSMDFMIAVPLDGIAQTIEPQIATLRDMSASDTPVIFANVHDALKGSWKISAFSFSITRTDEAGRAVMANASMSLTESVERLERFLLLPKFTYVVPKGSSSTTTTTKTDDNSKAESVYSAFTTKLADKYSIDQDTAKALNRLVLQQGATPVANVLAGLKGNSYTPLGLLNAIINAFKTPKTG